MKTLNVHGAVNTAIKKGLLPKLDGSTPCSDCGKPATEYDHRDYEKPLAVEPVCHSCNLKRGPAAHHHLRKKEPIATKAEMIAVGNQIRRLRETLSVSARQVSMEAGITHTTMQSIEGARVWSPNGDAVKRALLRIAVQRLKASAEVIEKLIA